MRHARTDLTVVQKQLSAAIEMAVMGGAPIFVTRQLLISMHFVDGMLRRGEDTIREEVADLVEEAFARFRRWQAVVESAQEPCSC